MFLFCPSVSLIRDENYTLQYKSSQHYKNISQTLITECESPFDAVLMKKELYIFLFIAGELYFIALCCTVVAVILLNSYICHQFYQR